MSYDMTKVIPGNLGNGTVTEMLCKISSKNKYEENMKNVENNIIIPRFHLF